MPAGAIHSTSVSDCVAETMFRISTGEAGSAAYVGSDMEKGLCRCIGGPAWFGYTGFDPRIIYIMSTGSAECDSSPKFLKMSPEVAARTYEAPGRIRPIGKYTVMAACDDVPDDADIKCIVCFGTSEQVRQISALIHYRSPNTFGAVSVPWGPACGTFVTYPAGLAENTPADTAFVGPVDPSARAWMPADVMGIGIPARMAAHMADDIDGSFLVKSAHHRS